MVKPSTVMQSCPSMDTKYSLRPLLPFSIRFGDHKQVKRLDPSSQRDTLKQYSELSSTRSSSNSLIRFSSSALVLGGGVTRCVVQLPIHCLRRLMLHASKRQKMPELHGLKKHQKKPFFGLQKIKLFWEHQRNCYVRSFRPVFGPDGSKNCMFPGNGLFLA